MLGTSGPKRGQCQSRASGSSWGDSNLIVAIPGAASIRDEVPVRSLDHLGRDPDAPGLKSVGGFLKLSDQCHEIPALKALL